MKSVCLETHRSRQVYTQIIHTNNLNSTEQESTENDSKSLRSHTIDGRRTIPSH